MVGYEDYHAFAEDFADLIESLRWEEDTVVEADVIKDLAVMQTANPKYADKFLAVADAAELTVLMEVGFGVDPLDPLKDYHDPNNNYFEEKGY